jgi:hypothetical protein
MTAKGDRFRYSDVQLHEIACRLKKAGINADLTPGGARCIASLRVGLRFSFSVMFTALPPC